MLETQQLDKVWQLYSVDNVNLLQQKSKLKEIKGNVKHVLKLRHLILSEAKTEKYNCSQRRHWKRGCKNCMLVVGNTAFTCD